MNRIISFFLCLFFISPLLAREILPFNNNWEFHLGQNASRSTTKNLFSDEVLFSNLFKQSWKTVTIPHTWNAKDMQTGKNNFHQGMGYYKKTFVPECSWENKRVFMKFQGIASVAEIYISQPGTENGDRSYKYVGNHRGGYAAFTVELTHFLKYGEENEILITVSNEMREDVIPINHILFGVYGGIYRPVELIITENIHIAVNDYASSGIYISQENVSKKSADVNLKIKLDNKSGKTEKVTIVSNIYHPDGTLKAKKSTPATLPPQGRSFIHQHIAISKPHLWSGIEDPFLYKVVSEIHQNGKILDHITQPLGLRHIDIKTGDGVYLNGKRYPMYGVCRHQDWWTLGSALENKHHDADLAIIKEMGATTIRLAHYQQSEYFYSKCDSIGFLVWAEIPFVNQISTYEEENTKRQLTELIRQNYNHPCIYIWGLHNEVYHPLTYTSTLTTTLNDLAKSEDPARYTVSVNGHSAIDHRVNNNADIQGINHYFGWYNGTIFDFEKWVNTIEKEYAEYNVIFSEYGAEANINQQTEVVSDRGDCCGFNKNYTETFATKFHEVHWSVIAKHPFLLASYIWNMFDFATPMSSQGEVESRNMKGLVTFDRKTKKDSFYWYKAHWSKDPVLHITQRRATKRGNKTTPITVYCNLGTPTLYVNGKEYINATQGLTDVHYIFNDINLNDGINNIEAIFKTKEQEHKDHITWVYSSEYMEIKNSSPELRKKEHIGL